MYLKLTIDPRAIKPFKMNNLNPLRFYIFIIFIVIRIKLSVSKRLVLCCVFVFPQQMPTFPGFIMWLGSMAFFTRFIRDTVPSPSSSFRYSFLPTPTPCSPVPTYFKFMLTRRRKKVTYKFRPMPMLYVQGSGNNHQLFGVLHHY